VKSGVKFPHLGMHDPGRAALRSAARGAIAFPAVLAVSVRAITGTQAATFALFGVITLVLLVEFGGPLRSRLIAYLALAGAGAAGVALGTWCSRDAWLAAGTMALVAFATLFSGVINGYFAAAAPAAILTFVFAATIPMPFSVVPARLAGWSLAAVAGIGAQLLLWPSRPDMTLRREAAQACLTLADLSVATFARSQQPAADGIQAARTAVSVLRRRFLETPHRPSGPTARQAAFGKLVEELDWLLSLLAAPGDAPAAGACPRETAASVGASVAALRAAAGRLAGRPEQPALLRLNRTRQTAATVLAQRLAELPVKPDGPDLTAALETAARTRMLSYTTQQIMVYAFAVAGKPLIPPGDEPVARQRLAQGRRPARQVVRQFVMEHASARSVWFRNSVRGAVGLAIAVYIARWSGGQHAFWVVLGTLSVLRTSALGTSRSILRVLTGTVLGIALGAALIAAIGADRPLLWAVLPPAVVAASYVPKVAPVVPGQLGFSVVLLVTFNLIEPVGWQIGLVRVQDVAIGCAVSLVVGLLLWPRGAARLLHQTLAAAYRRNAAYAAAAEARLTSRAGAESTGAAAWAAAVATDRLDDAFRQYLAERGPGQASRTSVAALVAGAGRVREAARSMSSLTDTADHPPSLEPCAHILDAEARAMHSWYVALAESLVQSDAIPELPADGMTGSQQLLACMDDAVVAHGQAPLGPALSLLWAYQHLRILRLAAEHLRSHAA